MARKSSSSKQKLAEKRTGIETEIVETQKKISAIRDGPTSRLEKTKKINVLRDDLRHLQLDLDSL